MCDQQQHLKLQMMGRALGGLFTQFSATKYLIVWMALIINLVSKAGVGTFDTKRGGQVQLTLPPSLSILVKQHPTGNLRSIITCVQAVLKRVNKSDQLTATMEKIIQEDPTKKYKVYFSQEVSTQ